MEFHELRKYRKPGIPRFKCVQRGIPWNSKLYVDKAWNTMNYVSTEIMEFQGLCKYSIEFHGIPSFT